MKIAGAVLGSSLCGMVLHKEGHLFGDYMNNDPLPVRRCLSAIPIDIEAILQAIDEELEQNSESQE